VTKLVAPFQVRWIKAVLKSDLDQVAKLVACAIGAHMNRYGQARPSKATLARLCSSGVSTVDRAVRRLQAAGWISFEPSNGRHANEYQGHLEPEPVPNPPASEGVQRAANTPAGDRVQKRAEKVPNPPAGDVQPPRSYDGRSKEEDKIKTKIKPKPPVGTNGNTRGDGFDAGGFSRTLRQEEFEGDGFDEDDFSRTPAERREGYEAELRALGRFAAWLDEEEPEWSPGELVAYPGVRVGNHAQELDAALMSALELDTLDEGVAA
jgi:hypothetical protein